MMGFWTIAILIFGIYIELCLIWLIAMHRLTPTKPSKMTPNNIKHGVRKK